MTTRTGMIEIDCVQVRSLLVDYFEDDASEAAELRQAIDLHLAKCRDCRALYDGVRNVISILGDDRVFSLPEGFSERLHARLEGEIASR
jgi:predicted anti-sigma-YlaC factor YlaD